MNIKTIFKIIIGFICLGLAFIGLFLPLLPTTPFVLLAVGCFSTTPKLRDKILKIGFIKEYYYCYTQKKPIRIKTKIFSLIFLWVVLIFSMITANKLYLYLLLSIVGMAVTAHILYLVSAKRTNCYNDAIKKAKK